MGNGKMTALFQNVKIIGMNLTEKKEIMFRSKNI